MTEQHAQFKAIGYQTETVGNDTRHKVWISGVVPDYMIAGAEHHILRSEAETLSHQVETEIWYMTQLPAWIWLPEVA